MPWTDYIYNKSVDNIITILCFINVVHPKVILFISHGGISGIYEAVDAGVPVLGFPLFLDQSRNIAHLVEAGMAISMEVFSTSIKEEFFKSVVELVNNEK